MKYQKVPSKEVQKLVLGESFDVLSDQVNSLPSNLPADTKQDGLRSDDQDDSVKDELPKFGPLTGLQKRASKFGPEPDFDNFDFQSEVE